MLAQQWPKGYCNRMGVQCKSRPNKFTIHGLWPQGLNGQLLTNCDASSSLSHDVSIFQFVMVRMKLFYML